MMDSTKVATDLKHLQGADTHNKAEREGYEDTRDHPVVSQIFHGQLKSMWEREKAQMANEEIAKHNAKKHASEKTAESLRHLGAGKPYGEK